MFICLTIHWIVLLKAENIYTHTVYFLSTLTLLFHYIPQYAFFIFYIPVLLLSVSWNHFLRSSYFTSRIIFHNFLDVFYRIGCQCHYFFYISNISESPMLFINMVFLILTIFFLTINFKNIKRLAV